MMEFFKIRAENVFINTNIYSDAFIVMKNWKQPKSPLS